MQPSESFNLDLSIRRTHGYRDGWSHLDEWDLVGEARIVRRFESDEECQDISELPGLIIEVEVNRHPGSTKRDIREALRDKFSGSRCTHEWDCCGCTYADVTKILPLNRKGTRWLLIQSRGRNY